MGLCWKANACQEIDEHLHKPGGGSSLVNEGPHLCDGTFWNGMIDNIQR